MSSPPHPPTPRPKCQPATVPGDDVGYPEPGQQHPSRGALPELALLQIFAADVLVLGPLRRALPRLAHPGLLSPETPGIAGRPRPTNCRSTPRSTTDQIFPPAYPRGSAGHNRIIINTNLLYKGSNV